VDKFLWVGLALFTVAFIINGARAIRSAEQFANYLEEKHPKKFREIYLDNALRKSLFCPFMRGTAVDLVWRSDETFGDVRVGILRSKVKQSALIAFVSLFAIFSWGLFAGVIVPALLHR
jgi:hypothetical protein